MCCGGGLGTELFCSESPLDRLHQVPSRGDGCGGDRPQPSPAPGRTPSSPRTRIGPIRTFTGLSWNDQLAVTMPDRVSMVSYGGLGSSANSAAPGVWRSCRATHRRCPGCSPSTTFPVMSAWSRSHPRPGRPVLAGCRVDYVADAVPHAGADRRDQRADAGHRRIRADTAGPVHRHHQHRPPAARRPRAIPTMWTARSPPTSPSFVDDGDTVQLGVGSLGSRSAGFPADTTDLGFHTG